MNLHRRIVGSEPGEEMVIMSQPFLEPSSSPVVGSSGMQEKGVSPSNFDSHTRPSGSFGDARGRHWYKASVDIFIAVQDKCTPRVKKISLYFFLSILCLLVVMFWSMERSASKFFYSRSLQKSEEFNLKNSFPIIQIQYVSCNRDDLAQDYWEVMAKTAMNEKYNNVPYSRSLSTEKRESPKEKLGCTSWQNLSVLPNATEGSMVLDDSDNASEWALPPPLDAFIWLGDIIYADQPVSQLPFSRIKEKWEHQFNATEYKAFRTSCVRYSSNADDGQDTLPNVWGVWDDHDMGVNDGGKEYAGKHITRQFLLDFLEAPLNDPRRLMEEGVYTFHTVPTSLLGNFMTEEVLPTPSNISFQRLMFKALQGLYDNMVCILLLDVRSFRDPVNITESGDMLGEAQWKWVENVLQNISGAASGRQQCALTVVGGGIQFAFDEKPTENWGSFPASRDRLLHLLRVHRMERTIFITGDVHLGELGLDSSPRMVSELLGYPLVEGTSSGLTHSVASMFSKSSRSRPSGRNRVTSSQAPLSTWWVPWIFPTSRRAGLFVGRNFGSIKLEAQHGSSEEFSELQSALENWEQGNTPSLYDTLQRTVSGLVNVTLTLFSLEELEALPQNDFREEFLNVAAVKGRLTVPLQMLMYDNGWAYTNSNVNAHTGFLERSNHLDASKVPRPPQSLGNNETHYFPSSPKPLLTKVIRSIQRTFLPDHSMLFSVYRIRSGFRKFFFFAKMVIILNALFWLVAFVFFELLEKIRRRRHREQSLLSIRLV